MKFDFCSDLHVDIWRHTTRLVSPPGQGPQSRDANGAFQDMDWAWYKNKDSNILIVAGDTSNSVQNTAEVLINAAGHYEYVIAVDGNHEHYDGNETVSHDTEVLRNLLAPHSNIAYLTGSSFRIGNTLFVGALGWYDWKGYEDRGISETLAFMTWMQRSNDSRYPQFAELGGPGSLAMIHAYDMAHEVMEAQDDPTVEEIVCVTHTSPRADLMYWHPTNSTWNELTPSYMNTRMKAVLDADVNRKITYWIYGHTHDRKMIERDGITYANNARGYPKENPGWFLPSLPLKS